MFIIFIFEDIFQYSKEEKTVFSYDDCRGVPFYFYVDSPAIFYKNYVFGVMWCHGYVGQSQSWYLSRLMDGWPIDT